MSDQLDLFAPPPYEPHFSGETYIPPRDWERLTKQLRRVFKVMKDGHWRTLADIARATGDPRPSVSARLRDFRKERFGGYQVERRHLGGGLYQYRLADAGP